jgi:hypothetical protein
MGNVFSNQETVVTLWKKQSEDILEDVKELAKKFMDEHCCISPSNFTGDVQVMIVAFDNYLKFNMPQPKYEAYMYNTTPYHRFEHMFKDMPQVHIEKHNVLVGAQLVSWPCYQPQKK